MGFRFIKLVAGENGNNICHPTNMFSSSEKISYKIKICFMVEDRVFNEVATAKLSS